MGFRLLLLVVVLAGFALRTTDLTVQNIWWDEARNIDVALRSFWAIPTAPELDIHPALYFWLLHLWLKLLGITPGAPWQETAFVARLLSVAAGTLAIPLLFQLARRMGHHHAGRHAGLIAATVAAASPFWLAESQEARMYTVGFALLAVAAYHLLALNQRPFPRPRSRSIYFVLVSAGALLTHYNAGFILVAWFIWWGTVALTGSSPWRRLGWVFLHGLGLTILVLPAAPIALRQIPGYANPNLTVPGIGEYLWANWSGYLGGYAWLSTGLDWLRSSNWWLWAILALTLLGAAGLIEQKARDHGRPSSEKKPPVRPERSKDPIPNTQYLIPIPQSPISNIQSPPHSAIKLLNQAFLAPDSFLLIWLFLGLGLYYIAVIDRGAFNIRYASFVTPALYTLIGLGLSALTRFHSKLPLFGVLVLLLGLLPAARADLTDARFFREDTAGLSLWLRSETGPGDVIFVDQKYPFGLYYERYAIDPAQEPQGKEAAPARYLFVDINTIDGQLKRWAGDARRVFWVEWFESDTDPRGSVAFLLDKYGTQEGEQLFRGYRVRWWSLNPPTDFVLAEAMTTQQHRWGIGLETVAVSVPAQGFAGRSLPVVVRWRRWGEPVPVAFKARVAVYDAGDGRMVQDDRRLLNDRHLLPQEWEASEPGATDQPLNVYSLPLPPNLPPGIYQVRLLLYDEETLNPFELMDVAGNPAGFEAVLGAVEMGDGEGR